MKRLAILHVIGNAALLGLGYYWLGVGESDGARLALSLALVLVFVAGAVWLHGTSLVYFREGALLPLRRIPALALFAAMVGVLYFALRVWRPLDEQTGATIASFFTMMLQKPVRPAWVQSVLDPLWWTILRVVIPTMLLPTAAGIAVHGWRGGNAYASQLRNWRYWALSAPLWIAVSWAPLALATWKPGMGEWGVEMASFLARYGFAYLLFVAACLLLAFVASRGKPDLSQPSTVPSP